MYRISVKADSHGIHSYHLTGIRTLSAMTFSAPDGMFTCVAVSNGKAIFYYAKPDSFGSLRASSPDPSFFFFWAFPRDSSVSYIKALLHDAYNHLGA